jgi:hypothetical protein
MKRGHRIHIPAKYVSDAAISAKDDVELRTEEPVVDARFDAGVLSEGKAGGASK